MSKRIAIVGAGTGGLHLGLYLLARGVEVTIHTDRRPEDYPKQRLLNTVAHHSITIARETELGVNHWPTDQFGYYCHYHHFGGEQPLFFRGEIEGVVAWPPRGSAGFGYDPIFQPEGHTRTFGEMSADEKHGWKPGDPQALSHRARAFKLFVETCLEA